MKRLLDQVEEIAKKIGYRENPYFKALSDGTFEKEDFTETQIQFYFAVIFFSRPIATLVGRVPEPELRLELIRNVWEEHGEGSISASHGKTFSLFLERLSSITPKDIDQRALWPEVRIFNSTLTAACGIDEYRIGVGCLGMIEYMFSEISGRIGKACIDRGWFTAANMIHYHLHEELDVKHSQDFFAIVESDWENNQEHQYFIEQGIWMGGTVFQQLYRGLYEGRKRRWFRPISGPHTRAVG